MKSDKNQAQTLSGLALRNNKSLSNLGCTPLPCLESVYISIVSQNTDVNLSSCYDLINLLNSEFAFSIASKLILHFCLFWVYVLSSSAVTWFSVSHTQ
jgi:hypothetical protein